MAMLRIVVRAPRSSGKMALMFILENKCNFCFSRCITLVSCYLGVSVDKLASHQFPAGKFVMAEGLERWNRQPSPGLDFPPGVCSAVARWLGCTGGRAAGSSHCPAGIQPWLASSSASRHWSRLVVQVPLYRRAPPVTFVTRPARLWGALPSGSPQHGGFARL